MKEREKNRGWGGGRKGRRIRKVDWSLTKIILVKTLDESLKNNEVNTYLWCVSSRSRMCHYQKAFLKGDLILFSHQQDLLDQAHDNSFSD